MAVAAIGALIKKLGDGAGAVLKVLAESDLAPIQANHIKAVELLLTDPEYAAAEPGEITKAILAVGAEADQEAKLFAATHKVKHWKALAVVWFRKAAKRRKAVGALDDVKRDTRPPKGRWQSGRYMRRCAICDCRFEGAINSTHCADCAYDLEVTT